MTARVTDMDLGDGWAPAAMGSAATGLGGILLFLASRLMGKAALQTAMNGAFKEIMEQMRTELRVACHQRDEFKALLEQEREGRESERTYFNGQISQLRAVSEGMERLLRANGVNIPERRVYAPQIVEVVEVTLRQDELGQSGSKSD